MENRKGFTLIEVVIVLMVGAVLLSISFRAFGDVQSRFAVRGARQAFASLHARARAQAIEYGQDTEFHFDVADDRLWMERNDTVFEIIDLQGEFGVDMTGASGEHVLCMNSRGFAASGCTSFSSTMTVTMSNGSDTETITVSPVGRLTY